MSIRHRLLWAAYWLAVVCIAAAVATVAVIPFAGAAAAIASGAAIGGVTAIGIAAAPHTRKDRP